MKVETNKKLKEENDALWSGFVAITLLCLMVVLMITVSLKNRLLKQGLEFQSIYYEYREEVAEDSFYVINDMLELEKEIALLEQEIEHLKKEADYEVRIEVLETQLELMQNYIEILEQKLP